MNYTELKHSDNGMPNREGLMYPILEVAKQQPVWKKPDLEEAVIDAIELPQDLRKLQYSNDKYDDLVIDIELSFSLSELVVGGLLKRVKRATYSITDLGREYLDKYGANLNKSIVHSIPQYIKYQENKHKNRPFKDRSITEDEINVNESKITQTAMESWFQNQKDSLKDDLLNRLAKMNPYDFESLMVELLNKMGYKGPNGQSIVTQKSNDNGIDGVIYQDALGLQKVYLQVKRYAPNNPVGRPEVTSFSGAVKLKHTDRGVFITTSTFTANAEEAAQSLNITTIDGEMLTNLMVRYGVGVEIEKSFNIYRIDSDAFDNTRD